MLVFEIEIKQNRKTVNKSEERKNDFTIIFISRK